MFNSDLMISLIKAAQGPRTLTQFAEQCGIDPGNLSRIINNKNKQAPKPETLRKIASAAQENVSYEDLMNAAGHLQLSGTAETKLQEVLSEKDEKDIEKKIERLKKDLQNNIGSLNLAGNPVSPEALESIVEALSYGIRQAKIVNKKYTPRKYRKKEK